MQAINGENLEFQAKPQVVQPKNKQKYRDYGEEDQIKSGLAINIMFDKKVVRGNTYAASVILKNQDKEKQKKETIIFKKPATKASLQIQKNSISSNQNANVSTPHPLNNRKNMECQTDEYVETLMDRPPERDIEIQTDFYIDKPPERLFVQKKYGIDQETQIFVGELFDFDLEVQPILQVLINKTFEQSRMEVLEEEELKLMKQQQKQFEKVRNAELVEMQRLEAVQKRLDEDEQRRRLQYQTARQQAVFSHEKLISRLISKNHLKNLKENTFKMLEEFGVFRDPLVASLQSDFIPWLYEEIKNELNQQQNLRANLNGTFNLFIPIQQINSEFLQDISTLNKVDHTNVLNDYKNRRQQIHLDRQAQKQQKRDQKFKNELFKQKELNKKQRQIVRGRFIKLNFFSNTINYLQKLKLIIFFFFNRQANNNIQKPIRSQINRPT